jgi:hypothetical protein
MSHVSNVKTSIKDLNILKDTLKELGYGYYEGQKITGQYLGGGQKADLVIENKNNRYGARSVGVIKDAEGNYNFKGDLTGAKKNFANEIIQKYTVTKLRMELRKMGSTGVSEIAQEDGSVKLVANL